jgi:hypothetical protein
MNTITPGTPTRKSQASFERDKILSDISSRWDLELEPPKEGESPSERQEKLPIKDVSVEDQCKIYANKCSFEIFYLCLKNKGALQKALESFEYSASVLQGGWVYKPDAGLLPRSISPCRIAATPGQRQLLLECLLRFLEPAFETAKKQNRKGQSRPSSWIPSPRDGPTLDTSNPKGRLVNDEPIPFHLGTEGRVKRSSDGSSDSHDAFKKPKLPQDGGRLSQTIIKAVDEVPVNTHHARLGHQTIAQQQSLSSVSPNTILTTMASNTSFKTFDASTPYDEETLWRPKGVGTNNTSFMSESSTVFSRASGADISLSQSSTQPSFLDTSIDKNTLPSPVVRHDSTQYVSSPNEHNVVTAGITNIITDGGMDEELVDAKTYDLHVHEEVLSKRLQYVFRELF